MQALCNRPTHLVILRTRLAVQTAASPRRTLRLGPARLSPLGDRLNLRPECTRLWRRWCWEGTPSCRGTCRFLTRPTSLSWTSTCRWNEPVEITRLSDTRPTWKLDPRGKGRCKDGEIASWRSYEELALREVWVWSYVSLGKGATWNYQGVPWWRDSWLERWATCTQRASIKFKWYT